MVSMMENVNEKSLKMRTMPMTKLIFSMSLPAILSMFVQALYNIVDTKYVSTYDVGSTNAVTALGYAFVVQMIAMAFGFGISIGGTILISRKLGERKVDEASTCAKTAIVMAVGMGLVMFGLSFIIPSLYMKEVSGVEQIQIYGIEYLSIVMMCSIFMMVELTLTKMLQGMGRMIVPMICQLAGAITNIILDPIFIFNLNMGISGAAIATVIGQFVSLLIVLIYVCIKNLDISINFKSFRFKFKYAKEIIVAGVPVLVMNSISAIVNIVLYAILRKLDVTEVSVGVLSVYFKLQSFVFMPVFGLTQGGLPILSYNFGANILSRFKKGLMILYVTSLSVMIIGFALFQLFPIQLLSFLSITDNALEIGKVALRIISLSFIPAAFGIISTTAFQAVGHGNKALIMSLLRQGVFLIPLAYLFSRFMDVKGVWMAYPVAETLCILIFFPILLVVIKKVFDKKENEKEKSELIVC